MKVLTAWFTMLLLSLLLMPVLAMAAAPSIQLFMNGKQLVPEVAPRIVNDNTIVPIRVIAESLGSKVSWDPKVRKVSVDKEGINIQLFIDKKQAMVAGKSYMLETAPTIIEGNTMLPIRFVSENLGVEVKWDEPTRSVFLYQQASDVKDGMASENGTENKKDQTGAGGAVAGNNGSTDGKNAQGSKDQGKDSEKPASSVGSGNPVKAGEQPVDKGANTPTIGCVAPESIIKKAPLAVAKSDVSSEKKDAVTTGSSSNKVEAVKLTKVQSISLKDDMLCIETSVGEVKPNMFKLSGPDRIVMDIPGAELHASLAALVNEKTKEGNVPLTEPSETVAKIRYSLFSNDPSIVRIVIDLQKKSELILSDMLPSGLIIGKFVNGKDKFRIVIDPGHGGKDPGAISKNNRREKDFVLALGNKVSSLLQNDPKVEVLMTRSDDTFIALSDRVAQAQQFEADLFISFHANSINKSNIRGTETFYWTEQSSDFAALMHRHVLEATGFPDRKVKQERFFVIRNTTMPAVLLEIGFLSNPTDEAEMHKDAFQNRVAASIVAAIKKQLIIN
ncbi:N-acetylmuramoyl-L-alanine amidase [Paenibacillus sp. PvR052]|nr:N-acetylmuramoyl-L-alanine amidase [Paenibacillus sp. PvP052]